MGQSSLICHGKNTILSKKKSFLINSNFVNVFLTYRVMYKITLCPLAICNKNPGAFCNKLLSRFVIK